MVCSAALLATGCLAQVIPEHEPATADEPTVQAMLRQRDFQGGGFVRINRAPFASQLEPNRVVTMFVSADAAAAYEAVSPETTTAGPPFPVGGVIVRAASDPSGNPAALTVMVKREPGYFPAVGDFFFGVTGVDGTPTSDAHGGTLWGKLGECAECHETRASAGFLFGVAARQR